MKKLIFLFAITLALFNIQAYAQQDAKAGQILDQVSKKYKSIPAFKAYFTYAMKSQTTGINEQMEGEITVKNAKYYLKLPGQEIINNGTTVWTYLKESNEVNIADYDPQEDEISPSKIYDIYKKGYKYSFVEEVVEYGQAYEVIDLQPENRKSQFFKIRLKINKADKLIKSWEVFEKNQNRYLYTITKFAPNVNVADNFFVFNKAQYKGVEVIDLR